MTKQEIINILNKNKYLIENNKFEELFNSLKPEEVKYIKPLIESSNIKLPEPRKLSREAEDFLETFPEYRYRLEKFEEKFEIKNKIEDAKLPKLIDFCDKEVSKYLDEYETEEGYSNDYFKPDTISESEYYIDAGEACLRLKMYFTPSEASSIYLYPYDEVEVWITIPDNPSGEAYVMAEEHNFGYDTKYAY